MPSRYAIATGQPNEKCRVKMEMYVPRCLVNKLYTCLHTNTPTPSQIAQHGDYVVRRLVLLCSLSSFTTLEVPLSVATECANDTQRDQMPVTGMRKSVSTSFIN